MTRVLPLDDPRAVQELFAKEGESIAAVILEPVPANNGLLVPAPGYLEGLRELTSRHGALLIFDEVITGFRVAPGGVAQRSGVTPDLVTFGKVIGGGLPVGAFGARRGLMQHLAPDGPVYQAGTLSGNPLAMAAGLAALDVMAANNGWRQLEEIGRQLDEHLAPVLARAPFPITLVRLGSIFWLALGAESAPRSAEQIPEKGAELFKPLFAGLLERGIMIAPSAYEVGFLSLAHREEHVERLAGALAEIFAAWPGE
ncbi:MAG: aminotransferase class III-fold pyridoxal phosphate-dependent enzyme [Acidobacteriota bacterium]|nr:aminotransferase class III-fold pyridoxal phosphate-dependent enzyme [Acidobacteriota bacterium]